MADYNATIMLLFFTFDKNKIFDITNETQN